MRCACERARLSDVAAAVHVVAVPTAAAHGAAAAARDVRLCARRRWLLNDYIDVDVSVPTSAFASRHVNSFVLLTCSDAFDARP